jgi:hypothetical protein
MSGGIQADGELLNLLNGLGEYVILTESLERGIKRADNLKITDKDILLSMKYILTSSIGSAAAALLEVLPSYEKEKLTDNVGINANIGVSGVVLQRYSHSGNGFYYGRSRTVETKPILSHSDIINMQANSEMIIYNTDTGDIWVAQITG